MLIGHRHACVNHSGIPTFDPSKELAHLIYLDANNLYGWAMSQSLPTRGFRWLVMVCDSKYFLMRCKVLTDTFIKDHLKNPLRKLWLEELYNEQHHYYYNGNCHICKKTTKKEDSALDHDHLVPEEGQDFDRFRGPVHKTTISNTE